MPYHGLYSSAFPLCFLESMLRRLEPALLSGHYDPPFSPSQDIVVHRSAPEPHMEEQAPKTDGF